MESDYLLGIHDEARMGALRFKTNLDGHFLNGDQAMAVPPWARLRELEEASKHVDDDSTDSEREKWWCLRTDFSATLYEGRTHSPLIFRSYFLR